MARAFFDYTITILEKVSFDPQLFHKELEKAYQVLLPHEQAELDIWLKNFLAHNPALKMQLDRLQELNKQEVS